MAAFYRLGLNNGHVISIFRVKLFYEEDLIFRRTDRCVRPRFVPNTNEQHVVYSNNMNIDISKRL